MTFFLLSFALIDFSWLLFNQMNMQDAVREAARYASTGNHNGSLSRNASIAQILNQAASGANIQSIVISNSSGSVGPDGKTPNAGGPGDMVTITAVCDVPLLTTAISSFVGVNNTFDFTVSSTFKNEPFPASQAN
jgi:Flp pilus assembly protein TadG